MPEHQHVAAGPRETQQFVDFAVWWETEGRNLMRHGMDNREVARVGWDACFAALTAKAKPGRIEFHEWWDREGSDFCHGLSQVETAQAAWEKSWPTGDERRRAIDKLALTSGLAVRDLQERVGPDMEAMNIRVLRLERLGLLLAKESSRGMGMSAKPIDELAQDIREDMRSRSQR